MSDKWLDENATLCYENILAATRLCFSPEYFEELIAALAALEGE